MANQFTPTSFTSVSLGAFGAPKKEEPKKEEPKEEIVQELVEEEEVSDIEEIEEEEIEEPKPVEKPKKKKSKKQPVTTGEQIDINGIFGTGASDIIPEIQEALETLDEEEEVTEKKPSAPAKPKLSEEEQIEKDMNSLDIVKVKVFGNELFRLESSNNTLGNAKLKDIKNRIVKDFDMQEFMKSKWHLIKEGAEGVLVAIPEFFKKG